jgi:hypothetical protein
VTSFQDLFLRLRRAWGWVAGQFFGTALLILAGIAWTRLPDKHAWQVALTLIIPLLLAICVLELQAATIRAFADDDGRRVRLPLSALTLVVWIAVGAILWWMLDWCDDRIPLWAGYINSKGSAHARVAWLSYEHLSNGMGYVEWVLRWIAVPGKLIVLAAASAQWGWRLQFRRLRRLLWNWRWWAAVVPAALIAVALPAHLFAATPAGTVSAQVWQVSLKLAAAYVLAMACWVALLGWAAVLFSQHLPAADPNPPADEALVPVPVLSGPEPKSLRAAAEIPPPDESPNG